MFQGASVVITAFDSARGEFNLAFENLTPEAKRLLDSHENQRSMKLALEEKGYAVHIVTTTTEVEQSAPIAFDEGRFTGGRKEKGEDRQEQNRENREEQ